MHPKNFLSTPHEQKYPLSVWCNHPVVLHGIRLNQSRYCRSVGWNVGSFCGSRRVLDSLWRHPPSLQRQLDLDLSEVDTLLSIYVDPEQYEIDTKKTHAVLGYG